MDVQLDIQLGVRNWRNHDDVRKNMLSDSLITEEQHLSWLQNLKTDKKNNFYVIFYDEKPVGIFSFNNISNEHLVADWGYYLRQDKKMPAISLLIEEKILDFYFYIFGFQKLNCEVLETNQKIIKLHKYFGFQEEGRKRKNIVRDNKRIDVILLGLIKEEWISRCKLNHS